MATNLAMALEESIQRRKQAKILELFDTVEFDPRYCSIVSAIADKSRAPWTNAAMRTVLARTR